MKKLVLVETVSMYRMRYAIEVEDDIDHALDCDIDNIDEVSQKYLDQTIVSHREITEEEYLKIFDEDNDYLSDWTVDQKKDYIHKVEYK